jgi:DNA-cytosine methyltransferase
MGELMTTVLFTGVKTATYDVLTEARKHFTQSELAKRLDIDVRTVRRWEVRESEPPKYVSLALKQLMLPLAAEYESSADFTFVDLFAGIGGIRRAFEEQGGRCVFTSEWDAYAQKTYAANFPDGHDIAGDITQVNEALIPDHDVLLAGFPCQPFSIAGVSKKNALGRAHGFDDETQGTLFFDLERIIAAKRPRAFLLENVKNLKSHDKGRTFEVIHRTLTQKLGYDVHYKVIDGAHFVPQHRERILIVGFREPVAFDWDILNLPPKGSHLLEEILHKTDGSEPVLSWDDGRFFDHKKRIVNPKYTLTENLWSYLQAYKAKHAAAGNGFGFGLVTGKQVSRTLSARYYKDGSEILISQGASNRPRRLTPRECARLMGFSDEFRIPVSDTRAYQQFADAAVVPVIASVARLLLSSLKTVQVGVSHEVIEPSPVSESVVKKGLWTKEQVKLAFHLYCQLPFGKLDQRTAEVIELARLIGRTPSAVAMKLVNLASLDPAIRNSGRAGLSNASALDRQVWDAFHADWEALAIEAAQIKAALASERNESLIPPPEMQPEVEDFVGLDRQVLATQRVKQSFFRRAVLSGYRGRCCMSGLSDSRLLIASHIVPWSYDKNTRLNPRNGLCLSAIHDKAFDRGLITLSDEFTVVLSAQLLRSKDAFVKEVLIPIHGKQIELPERFLPSPEFIEHHRTVVFANEKSTSAKRG